MESNTETLTESTGALTASETISVVVVSLTAAAAVRLAEVGGKLLINKVKAHRANRHTTTDE